MNSSEIRDRFYRFFEQRGHQRVASSSLIPAQDPTLLFTNAGMNQFKDIFLGQEVRSYKRAVSIQACIRAGGKHNDLEMVGFTARHLTFFEMMGNFSFGDYFKKEAIRFAWEFLTQEIKLDPDRLWASVYEKDEEAALLWKNEIGLPADRIIALGAKDNFWQMGDTGPCGPCSEIYVDRGMEIGCGVKHCAPGCSCDRFLEVWNLVFMQFDRQADGTDKPLAQRGVDTGMGLERLSAIVQNVPSVFQTDLFVPLLSHIERLTGRSYQESPTTVKAAFHVLADHIRSLSAAIADGCMPAPDGRGYVVRKIIRRAALFASQLSTNSFLPELVHELVVQLGGLYPQLVERQGEIISVLSRELEQFSRNLVRGKQLLDTYITQHPQLKELPGSLVFMLYDTYGFPAEITRVIARAEGLTLDDQEFEREMAAQQKLSRSSHDVVELALAQFAPVTFTGYAEDETRTTVQGLLHNNLSVTTLPAGSDCWVIPAATPFYAAGGGQGNDEGMIVVAGAVAQVQDVAKQGEVRALRVTLPMAMTVGDTLTMMIDKDKRLATERNHTATHLLQSGLRKFLGSSVRQSGSAVHPDYLRFDFTYSDALTQDQLEEIERFVNQAIIANIAVHVSHTTLQQAQQAGAMAFFGEKYTPESVRVVTVGDISAELCGGTHVKATGQIGFFKIRELSAPSAGNKRIVAVTGLAALAWAQETAHIIKSVSLLTKSGSPEAVLAAYEKQAAQFKKMTNRLRILQKKVWHYESEQWIKDAKKIKDILCGVVVLEEVSLEEIKELAHILTVKAPGLWCVVSTEKEREHIIFVAALAEHYRHLYSLKQLMPLLQQQGFKGGGDAVLIQGGAARMPNNLRIVFEQWIESTQTK